MLGMDAGFAAYAQGDYVTAAQIFEALARDGHAVAQFNIGLMFIKGHGVSPDLSTAAKWYQLAAEQGHLRAQLSLGLMYENGEGVARDDSAALAWY